ncbi:hypothetical protein ASPCAL00717 [Aspergillus calidoustus]|uniref:Uncharacterized protein n=1 Tax=Aspergillus calidoustus TaxID=454130 RepID=A0A0U4YW10_ASPCI|nr:hypothetical protein ASPCAL00717 [Aspergillus calidoustus]
MMRTTAPPVQDISHILSKHYAIATKSKEKKYRPGIFKARSDDTKPIIPGFPFIKEAKKHKTKQLWRCANVTTEAELVKEVEMKESTRTAETRLAGLRQRIHVVYPEHRLIRPKLEVVLDSLLNHALNSYRKNEQKKKEKKKTRLFSSGPKPNTRIPELVSITGERSLTRRQLVKGVGECCIATKVDHLVLHGEPEDLEVSAIIVRARKVGEIRVDLLLANMARIHEARLLADEKSTEIWGIATDCERWTFAYIDNKSRCSYHRLTWSSHKNQIVSHIMRIFSKAMDRATKVAKAFRPSRAAVWRQKVKRYAGDHEIHPSGLRIFDRKRRKIYSRRDDFTGKFLDFEDD